MTIFYLDYENGSDSNDGSDWANAWKTFTSGATAARIAPGDEIRIAKSPAPYSLGNGTWTNNSYTVTLASAQTATIDMCESIWTANGSGDTTVALVAVTTDAKEGSYSMRLTLDSSPQTSTMQAYYQISDTDFSSYQKISFWIKNSSAIANATTWKVCLCSDTAGATPVDTFYIPAIPSTNRWLPLTLTKDGGGNLGSSIQSIAIYTHTSAPTASSNILVDCFIACTSSGLNLQSLISKNSSEQGGTEAWYAIQSISGTTVIIDAGTATKSSVTTSRYYTTGTSPDTVTTYARETIKTAMASSATTSVQSVSDSGSVAGGNIVFEGGYDTGSTIQNGETFFDGLNGNGNGIYYSSKAYITLNHLSAVRYNYGIYMSTSSHITVSNVFLSGNNTGYTSQGSSNISFSDGFSVSNGFYGALLAGEELVCTNMVFMALIATLYSNGAVNMLFYSCTVFGQEIQHLGTSRFYDCGFYDSAVLFTGQGEAVFFNCVNNCTSIWGSVDSYINSHITFHDYNDTIGDHRVFFIYGDASLQGTTTQSGSGYAWDVDITSSNSVVGNPLKLPLGKIAVQGGNTVTVTAYCKKSHATNVGAKLVLKGGDWLDGVIDTTDTKADDTDWEQLSVSCTPTENCVIEIEGWSWYIGDVGNVYWDTMSITEV